MKTKIQWICRAQMEGVLTSRRYSSYLPRGHARGAGENGRFCAKSPNLYKIPHKPHRFCLGQHQTNQSVSIQFSAGLFCALQAVRAQFTSPRGLSPRSRHAGSSRSTRDRAAWRNRSSSVERLGNHTSGGRSSDRAGGDRCWLLGVSRLIASRVVFRA